jgi:hypothetical protein
MRRRLLHGMACSDALTSLPPARQAERRRGHEPIGQDRESLPARLTYSAAHRVPSSWPVNRDFDMFQRWFEYRFHSMLVDLWEDPLERDEL